MNRKEFLRILGMSGLSLAATGISMDRLLAATKDSNKVLVLIFLRGAADGLHLVPPVGDSAFTKDLRPELHMPLQGSDALLRLNDYFYLHPAMKPLMPLWEMKRWAIVHQVGSPDATRSHFDAQDFMESGTPGAKATEDGFLNRVAADLKSASTLKALALQPSLPRILWGSSGAFAVSSIQEFSVGGKLRASGLNSSFESLYDEALDQALRGAGQQTFQAMDLFKKLPSASTNADYPKSPLGKQLSDLSRLIRGQVGLRIAVTESGGWDSHRSQGTTQGALAKRIFDLSQSLAAFTKDIKNHMDDVCIVTVTEFGRTVKQNGAGGTDHGHGSVMFVLGAGTNGKQVIANWKPLKTENLYEGRDLPVTTDFRDVWSEILSKHLSVKELAKVFPNYSIRPLPQSKLFA